MSKVHTHYLPRLALRWLLGGFAASAIALGSIQLHAQSIAAHNSRAPITVDAGNIVAQGRQNRVSASGGVVVTQADLTVRSLRMLLNYEDEGSLNVGRITAIGGVTIARGNEQAKGDVAVYDLDRRIITMAGNVRLQRGDDWLEGARLMIDLESGISSFDGGATGDSRSAETDDVQPRKGRVRGQFAVPQD